MAKKKTETATAEVKSEAAAEITETAVVETAVEETVETAEAKKAPAKKAAAKKTPAKKAMPSLSEGLAAASEETAAKKVSPGARVASEGESAPAAKKDKYNVTIAGNLVCENGSKIAMAVALIRHAIENGMSQTELNESKFVATFPLLRDFPEGTTKQEIIDELGQHKVRYATKEDKHIMHSKTVMVVCNQWYPANAEKLITAICERFEDIKVDIV
jgi:predicted nucleic acid-binding protein